LNTAWYRSTLEHIKRETGFQAFAFKCNLCRYTEEEEEDMVFGAADLASMGYKNPDEEMDYGGGCTS
jgi:hypothetical protein